MTTTGSTNEDPLGLVGVTIDGRYQVVRLVDQGGFSYVYQARHVLWKSPVAVKCLKHLLRDAEIAQPAVQSFIAEGAILAELSGRTANIVQARDVGTLSVPGGGVVLYMVLEWLEGTTLEEELRSARASGARAAFGMERVLPTLETVARALSMAHGRGIIHRDIKPSNIFLVRDEHSGGALVKLLDFGVAKVMQEVTQTSDARGPFTPAYGAPEQFDKRYGPTGPWTDVYALALVGVELLVGRRPTSGENVIEFNVAACDRERRPTPRQCGLDLGEAIEAVFQKALAVRPSDRFQRAREFWEALAHAAAAFRSPTLPGEAASQLPERGSEAQGNARRPSAGRRAPEFARPVALIALAIGMAGTGALLQTTRNVALAEPIPKPLPKAPIAAEPEIANEPLASFAPLPSAATSPDNPLTEDKIKLGRMLFHEPRLSRNHDISCSSCHPLDTFGTDGKRLSVGHAQQVGTRNTPSIYNVAGQFAFGWDGRSPLLEPQAKAPLLAPHQMAMDEARIKATLRSIPGYTSAFASAFPGQEDPISTENAARALAAFERKLFTRGRWDAFLEGDQSALTGLEKEGFNKFIDVGCVACHFGPYVGATMFQKAGLVKPWPNTRDRGRFEVTKQDVDWMVFKVPSLRNVAVTGPYFHDGSVSSLEEAIRVMARHQLGKELREGEVASIQSFLRSLTGELPRGYAQQTALPESGPRTPSPEAE